MVNHLFHQVATVIVICLATIIASAQPTIDYNVTIEGNASTGDFAPYMIGSWNHGKLTRKSSALLDVEAHKCFDLGKRFDYAFGIEALTGYQSATDYARFDASTSSWGLSRERPAAIWLQQLYGEIKYRGVFLSVGMKEHGSKILDDRLSSGDLTRSNNARPMPGAEVGFVDFQDIPFTEGWVQINGEIFYGRSTDGDFIKKQYNYYNSVVSADMWYTYKYCYFRTKPEMPLSVTVGMQTAGQFAGYAEWYRNGELYQSDDRGFHFKDLIEMFYPGEGSGEGYYKGNSLGSWDFRARYRLRDGKELSFYFEWPWEDGSGIGKQNGWDGLWGIEYRSSVPGIINGAAIEYLDFRNQSGPIHWSPGDAPGTTITGSATGGDNYYNNSFYMAYTNYGMAIATPFLVAPIYNLNGLSGFAHNRAQGFHASVTGNITPAIDYRLMVSYQKAWGMGRTPQAKALHDTSAMAEACWQASALLQGLSVRMQVAFDAGSLRGDNFGAMLAVTYSGSLFCKKK